MNTHVVDHPLVAARLTELRDIRTGRAEFKALLHELSLALVYEAARDYPVISKPILTPLASMSGVCLEQLPLIVPVLRAGLGMLNAATRVFPGAAVGFVGLSRDEKTFQAHQYMATLPADLTGSVAFVLDPMLATGGSVEHCCRLLTDRGIRKIVVVSTIAAPEGLARLERCEYPLAVYTAAVDERLDEVAFIVPGLGDAGDRQFGKE